MKKRGKEDKRIKNEDKRIKNENKGRNEAEIRRNK